LFLPLSPKSILIPVAMQGNIIKMAKYPIFLELGGRRVVLIGGGAVAVRKARALLDAGARLVVVAEHVDDVLTNFCTHYGAELIRSKYSKNYLGKAILVIAATNNPKLNKQIYKDCQELEILCNVVDDPQLCDFFAPAIVKRGNLQIAIGTEGYCPAYAGHIRKKLEQVFTEKHGQFLNELETLRKKIIKKIHNPTDRKTLLGELVDDESFEYFVKNGSAAWRDRAEKIIKQHKSQI
jgi:precorrin-2 dehydrogenase/sirohydrochlorin ferrochelatase